MARMKKALHSQSERVFSILTVTQTSLVEGANRSAYRPPSCDCHVTVM